MRKIALNLVTEFKISGVRGFFQKKVTPFGTGAKIDCPKEYLGKTIYVVVVDDGIEKTT